MKILVIALLGIVIAGCTNLSQRAKAVSIFSGASSGLVSDCERINAANGQGGGGMAGYETAKNKAINTVVLNTAVDTVVIASASRGLTSSTASVIGYRCRDEVL